MFLIEYEKTEISLSSDIVVLASQNFGSFTLNIVPERPFEEDKDSLSYNTDILKFGKRNNDAYELINGLSSSESDIIKTRMIKEIDNEKLIGEKSD